MSDLPGESKDRIESVADELGALSLAIAAAYQELEEAERAWLPLFDATAETLKEEMRDEGRKGDPAEHRVLSVTRRAHPSEYQRLRSAKHDIQKLETISQNRRSELTGYQTAANTEGQGKREWKSAHQRQREAA